VFSSTLKRSVATLGVVAGLLTTVGAGAAGADTLNGGPGGDRNPGAAVTSDSGAKPFFGGLGNDTLDAAAGALDVAASEVFELNTFGGDDTLLGHGTQVGSEQVVVLIGANDYGFADTSHVGVANNSR